MEHEKGVRVFLVDDHPAVREGLAIRLEEAGHECGGFAGSRKDVLEQIDRLQADVVLLDLSLDGEWGLDLIELFQARGVAVVVYSMHEDRATVEEAFTAGANGYVTKREFSSTLLEAIREVLSGQRYVSPLAARKLVGRLIAPIGTPAAELSRREQEILDLLGQGEGKKSIALRLHISARTVETHCTRIIGKLGLGGMEELRKTAIKRHVR